MCRTLELDLISNFFYLFVEGSDDKRLFDEKIKPILLKKYDAIKIYKYSEMKKEQFDTLISTVIVEGADYVLIHDYDHSTCISGKKQELSSKFMNISIANIVIVIQEIESWYLAGLTASQRRKYQVILGGDCNSITKGGFDDLFKGKFISPKACRIEILRDFSAEEAVKNNKSFSYFHRKFLQPIIASAAAHNPVA